MGYYKIKKTSDNQFMFNLHAGNHEIILTSERYTRKENCLNGIKAVQDNSPVDANYKRMDAANGEITNAWMIKAVSTADGGVIVLCRETSEQVAEYSTLLVKIDSLMNIEWYYDYAYQFGDDHYSEPHDVEQTSDGGYIVAGQYSNWNISIGQRGWLLKVDACGDVEWQGCELADGLFDITHSTAQQLTLFPNPASDVVFIEGNGHISGSPLIIFDQQGRVVLKASSVYSEPLDISSLAEGIYLIQVNYGQSIYSARLNVVR